MIDANDKQTKPLALDTVPGNIRHDPDVTGMQEVPDHGVSFAKNPMTRKPRGRPATGQALSNADRQRAYRERQKAQRNENQGEGLTIQHQAEYIARAYSAEHRVEELEARIRELEAQLAQRNEKTAKTWTLQGRTGTGKWQNLAAGLDEKEAHRQLDRVIDAKISGESKRQYRMVQD